MKKYLPAISKGLLLSSTFVAANAPAAIADSPKLPNIIYIMADDLGYGDLSCYGQQKFKTPNIDKMASDGMTFLQHYSGTTVSAPSRCALMTGYHTGHAVIRGNAGERTPNGVFDMSLPQNSITVADMVKKKNYATACIGKWGMGGPGTAGHPNKHGFDYFYGHLSQLNAHFSFPDSFWENETKVDLKKEKYAEDLLINKAVDYITENKDKPFFLYFAVTIPHAELIIADEYMMQDSSYCEKPYVGNHYGSQPRPHAAFASMVKKLDSDVGRLRQLLKDLNIDDNTLIIFTSDNGPHLEGGADPNYFDGNGPFTGYKRDLYDGGVRIPFITCWNGKIKPGQVSTHISAFWDFLPTVCDLIGEKAPKGIDGISYLPELIGKKQKQHDYLYWEFHEENGKQAVRQEQWKLVKRNVSKEDNPVVELYDLNSDPAELHNVAYRYPKQAQKMDDMIKKAHVYDEKWPLLKSECDARRKQREAAAKQ